MYGRSLVFFPKSETYPVLREDHKVSSEATNIHGAFSKCQTMCEVLGGTMMIKGKISLSVTMALTIKDLSIGRTDLH